MSGQHTPGPWRIGSAARDYVVSDAFGVVGNLICEAPQFTSSFENWEANARLIAAGPELLAALKDFADEFPGEEGLDRAMDYGLDAILVGARAAIAKAEGGAK